MKKIITILLFTLLLSLSVFTQDEDKKEENICPGISLAGPATTVKSGEIQAFELTISGGKFDEQKIQIKWSVESATIVQGQGTKTLKVIDTLENGGTIRVTANVDAGGDCVTSTTETGLIVCPPSAVLIDEFGNVSYEDVYARIDAFMIDLQNNPSDQGYIINYGSKRKVLGREKLIRDYMQMRNFDALRIVYVNGGVEENTRTRIWRVPAGADTSIIN